MKKTLLFFSFFIFIACNQNDLVTYKSNKGYSFKYSEVNWKIEESITQTLLFNKQNKKQDFNPNINILIQDLEDQPISLEEYHNLTLTQMEQALGSNTILSEKELQISGILAKEIIYTMPRNINRVDVPELKLKQIYLIKNNKAYLITYTAKMSDFPILENSANDVFETFKIFVDH